MNSKVPVVRPVGRAKIELDSIRLLQQVQPDALLSVEPVDIELIFDVNLPILYPGLKTGYVDLSHMGMGVLGYTGYIDNRKVSYVDKKLYDATLEEPYDSPVVRRFRATVAHEISHCYYHLPYLTQFASLTNAGGLMRRQRKDIKAYEDPEWQAWEQAGALLMPKARMEDLIKRGLSKYEIANIFNVNPSFVEARIDRMERQKK